MKNLKNVLLSTLFSAIGFLLIVYYILNSSVDVVASDYIRIINYYLNNVFDLHLLFSFECISRIPITFIMRIINVIFFDYSVYFDKIIGVLGLFIFNYIVLYYFNKNIDNIVIKIIGSFLISVVSFSLMGWEMILNGTGYAHFWSIGLYAVIFYLYTYIYNNTNRLKTIVLFLLLLVFISLFISGPYMVAPICSLIIVSIIDIFIQKKSKLQFVFLLVINGLLNYILIFLARYKFYKDNYGMSSRYSLQYMILTISIILTIFLLIKRLYNINNKQTNNYKIQTKNQIEKNKNNIFNLKNNLKYCLLVFSCIICLLLYFISNNTGTPLVPVGIKNIDLIYLLKNDIGYIFSFFIKSFAGSVIGVESFSYSLQLGFIKEDYIYIIGLIYLSIIIFTLICFVILYLDDINIICLENYFEKFKKLYMGKVFFCIVLVYILGFIFAGHMITNYTEIQKIPVRKYIYQNLKNIALYLENVKDEELPNVFEYHRDIDDIKNAIEILKKNKYNIFSEKNSINK